MAHKINVEKLDEFNDMVDQMVEDIEAGRITANPLKPETKTVVDIEAEDLVVKETATELGEDAVSDSTENYEPDTEDGDILINGKAFKFTEDGEFNGRAGKVLVVVSNEAGEVAFGSAAVAADETGFNPTTVRKRCSKEYVDTDGNTWKYRDKA